ncbi:hypothetical protein Hte_008542 [Hypoxylon texense]
MAAWSRFGWIDEQSHRGAVDTPLYFPATLVLVLRNYNPYVPLTVEQLGQFEQTPFLDHRKAADVPVGQAPLIYANFDGSDLIWDFTLTSQLAVTLVKNFEVNNNEPVALNRVLLAAPTLYDRLADGRWLYEELQRAFRFPFGNYSQKRASAQAVDWASDWVMTRARFLMTTIRDDPRTFPHLYNVPGIAPGIRRGDVWLNSASYAIHKPNLLQDWYIVSMTQNPFTPPKSLWPQFESTDQFQAAAARLFEQTYRLRLEDAEFLHSPDNLLQGSRGATPNAVHIFTWLVAYVNRYLHWRCQAFEALNKKHFCRQRRHQRWVLRVDGAFNAFLVYFRRLLKQQRTYTKLRQATWLKAYFSIMALNALVRLCKLNYTTANGDRTFQDYSKAIGKPHNFPNFVHNVSILRSRDMKLTASYVPAYNDVCDAPRTHFPQLLPESRFPNEPNPPPFSPGAPGGEGGSGGPDGYGGFGGLGGYKGRGKSGSGEAVLVDLSLVYDKALFEPTTASEGLGEDSHGKATPANTVTRIATLKIGTRSTGQLLRSKNSIVMMTNLLHEEDRLEEETKAEAEGPEEEAEAEGPEEEAEGIEGMEEVEETLGMLIMLFTTDTQDWWNTHPDSTGGWEDGLPNWTHYRDGTTRAGIRDEGELDEDMEPTQGEDWSSDWSDVEPASDDEQDEDELLLENPSERSQENKRKIEIAEELRAEVESESATIRAPDGLTRPNRASPVFTSSVPKYHLRVQSRGGSSGTMATNGSDTTIVVRRPVQHLELSDVSDALREAVMSRGGYSAPTRGVSKRSPRRDRFKGVRRRTLQELVV